MREIRDATMAQATVRLQQQCSTPDPICGWYGSLSLTGRRNNRSKSGTASRRSSASLGAVAEQEDGVAAADEDGVTSDRQAVQGSELGCCAEDGSHRADPPGYCRRGP